MKLLEGLPARVSIYEVSPRDGLQNEQVVVPLRSKLRLIDALASSGLSRIEVTSFVAPKWVPQLADAEEVCRHLPEHEGVVYSALCPNKKGLERVLTTPLKEIAVFLSASETHNRKNINQSIDESLAGYREVIGGALAAGLRVRAYVSMVWGCPYEGKIAVSRVVELVRTLLSLGCYQVSLGDTIGVGTPVQTASIVDAVLACAQAEQIALHLHDTRGTALANVLAGLQHGITHFDAAVSGMGGCPYAPGASGNVATEDLVYMLEGMGVHTGVDLARLVEAGRVAEGTVGRSLPGKVHQAGLKSLGV